VVSGTVDSGKVVRPHVVAMVDDPDGGEKVVAVSDMENDVLVGVGEASRRLSVEQNGGRNAQLTCRRSRTDRGRPLLRPLLTGRGRGLEFGVEDDVCAWGIVIVWEW